MQTQTTARIFEKLSVLGLLAALLTIGCAATPQATVHAPGIDQAIAETARQVLNLVPRGEPPSLAVYYFTTGDQKSDLSDYVTNGLTTELANAGAGIVRVVSRQLTDRLTSEYKYQLTDLVEKSDQVEVGKQLGADLILTGFVTPGANEYRLNAQLIATESAQVIGGIATAFIVPKDLRVATAQAPPTASEVREQATARAKTEGVATITQVIEDFDHGISAVTLDHYEDSWGERILSTAGTIGVATDNGNSFARYEFESQFDQTDFLNDWQDSDAGYYGVFNTSFDLSHYEGVSFDIKLSGASKLIAVLTQRYEDADHRFYVPLQIVPGTWRSMKIPFSLFVPDEPSYALQLDQPADLEFYVPFGENRETTVALEDNTFSGDLSIDTIGLYNAKGPRDPALIEAFEDEISRTVATAEMYGAAYYEDYSESDEGLLRKNTAVESCSIDIERRDAGPVGGYLSITSALKVTSGFPGEVAIYPNIHFVLDHMQPDAGYLTFAGRSSFPGTYSVGIDDMSADGSYYGDVTVGKNWSRIRVKLADLGIDDPASLSSHLMLSLSTELLPSQMARQVQDEALTYTFDIDELAYE